MAPGQRRQEAGRAERVLDGLWRLRLPLPLPEVPHVNAYALTAGDDVLLIDCGVHNDRSMHDLEAALGQAGLRLHQVRRLLITHTHLDHWGQAARVVAATGCELWIHPRHRQLTLHREDPEVTLARRSDLCLKCGVPESVAREFLADDLDQGLIGPTPSDWLDLVPGAIFDTDLGMLAVYETPGHAPSHVCFHEPSHRLLISGDHVMGPIAPHCEHGFTVDPLGEFLASLDVVATLDARIAVSGHGKPFSDVHLHIEANRRLVHERLEAVQAALAAAKSPVTVAELVEPMHHAQLTAQNVRRWTQEIWVLLEHLEQRGQVTSESHDGVLRWRAVAS